MYSTGDDILSDITSEKGDVSEEGEIPSVPRFVLFSYVLLFIIYNILEYFYVYVTYVNM